MLSINTIKPANERKIKTFSIIKLLKNSWISVKRSELLQQKESLVPFLSDGLGVKIPFQGVFKDRSEVFMRMDYFHLLVIFLDRPVREFLGL